MEWDYRAAFPKDHFQFVWASPACTHFSLARTTGGPRDIEGATALVKRCLEIADYFGCEWCLENPATGLLRCQPLMQGLAWTDTCYCKYGFEYRKHTRLWRSRAFGEAFRPHSVCRVASPCPGRGASQIGSAGGFPHERRGAQAERRMLPGAALQHAPGALRPGGRVVRPNRGVRERERGCCASQ